MLYKVWNCSISLGVTLAQYVVQWISVKQELVEAEWISSTASATSVRNPW